jgi:hypothetical protein
MAKSMKIAPIPEIKVNISFNTTEDIVIATITSVKRIIVDVTGEMYFKLLNHK